MRRREFIAFLGGATAWPASVKAQRSGKLRRVGLLVAFAKEPEREGMVKAFKQAFEDSGWVDGKTVQLDERWAGGNPERIRALSTEIIDAEPDVIFAVATPVLAALYQKTRTIPLVFVNVSDPVDGGFVQSMSRPGGNVTGFTSLEYSIGGKWLELLKETVPSLDRVLVLLNPANYTSRALLATIKSAATKVGVEITEGNVRAVAEIETAIASFAQEPRGALIVPPDPLTTTNRRRIIELATVHRLPGIHPFRWFATEGGLMAYGTDDVDLYRKAAGYVDRILKGAKPGDLPVQNPLKYRLTINLKAAKAIGLDVASQSLLRADEVIE
jgi:putative ABC transport system substrate-binding protein